MGWLMDVPPSVVITALLGGFGYLLLWFFLKTLDRIDDLTKAIAALREVLLKDYCTKVEANDLHRVLAARLDGHDDAISAQQTRIAICESRIE